MVVARASLSVKCIQGCEFPFETTVIKGYANKSNLVLTPVSENSKQQTSPGVIAPAVCLTPIVYV